MILMEPNPIYFNVTSRGDCAAPGWAILEPFFLHVFFSKLLYIIKYGVFDGFCMHRRIEVDDARNSNSVNSVLPSLSGSLQEPRSGRILRAAGSHGRAVAEMEVCHAEATRHTCTNLDHQQTATRLTNSKLPANVEEFWIVSSSYLRMISWCILMIKCTSVCNQSDLRTLGLTRDFLFQKIQPVASPLPELLPPKIFTNKPFFQIRMLQAFSRAW